MTSFSEYIIIKLLNQGQCELCDQKLNAYHLTISGKDFTCLLHTKICLCVTIQNILNKDDHDDDVPFIVLHTGMHN